MEALRQRWQALQERIAAAAQQAGRSPDEIGIVAVTKTRPPEQIQAAVDCGLTRLGENRVQEAASKHAAVAPGCQWHLIGHLQTNKAKQAASLFDVIQSVDSRRVADALDRRAGQAGRQLDILIQVNTSGASGQSGVDPEDTAALADVVAAHDNLVLRGLMTIGANSTDERIVRGCFSRLRELLERLRGQHGPAFLVELSMGMSNDFEWAILEGATTLRLGTVLFGPRPAGPAAAGGAA